MRGMFQNCESLISLSLPHSGFSDNVEIMWDMFKGCRSLNYLELNFDTSKVTDMESMFEGCSSLESLDLSSFKTPKVQYMNKMFKDCINLRNINIKYFTAESLGTMHQMFYNCTRLEYLNIYSLNEKDQSISEIFKGASNNFKFCVKEHENIPKIFKFV